MPTPWSAEFWRIVLFVVPAAIVGLILHAVWLCIALALGGYLAWHLYNLHRFERWLRADRSLYPPDAGGIWGEVLNDVYRLQQRHRQGKRRLAHILGRFQKATAAMPDATVVLGPLGDIQWFNEAARHLLALRPTQDIGQRIDNLVRHPAFITYLHNGDYDQPLQMPSVFDPAVTLNVRVVPYGNDQRLLIARDISHLQRLEQMRRDFVANVSHELRTPLTVVSGFLETLAEGDDPCTEKWARSLHLMQQQSSRMGHIVEDLLLLSRLEMDRQGPRREAVPVPAVLEMIRKEAEVLAADKKHTIELESDPELLLFGAETELHSAFNNLVTNAIRYTPEGGRIALRWYADSAGAHFEVRDTGVGIAPQHIPRLTERFYRVDVGRSRQSGGTGLGLAIVKHVLSRHDARLRIESRVGRGSLFACDFPFDRIARDGDLPVAASGNATT